MTDTNLVLTKENNDYWLEIFSTVDELRKHIMIKLPRAKALEISKTLNLKFYNLDTLTQAELEFQNK